MRVHCCKNCKHSVRKKEYNDAYSCGKHKNFPVFLGHRCPDYEYDEDKCYWKLSELAECIDDVHESILCAMVFLLGWGPGGICKYDEKDKGEILLTPKQAVTLDAIFGARKIKTVDKIIHVYRKYGDDVII